MKINKVRMNYSYIGNFIDLLVNNEQRIKNLLPDFEMKTKLEVLPDKREVNSLMFINKNIIIRVTPIRIDFDYGFMDNNVDDTEIFEAASKFFKLFGEIFYNVRSERIALVVTAFSENINNSGVSEMTSKFNMQALFGNCNELSFKINGIKQYKEQLNSVVVCEMGKAKNNQSNDQIDVLLYRIDVNTMFANREKRFEPINFDSDFQDLYAEAEERFITLQNF